VQVSVLPKLPNSYGALAPTTARTLPVLGSTKAHALLLRVTSEVGSGLPSAAEAAGFSVAIAHLEPARGPAVRLSAPKRCHDPTMGVTGQ
jgi:hypothetical protein